MRSIRAACVLTPILLAVAAATAPANAQVICEKNGKFKLRSTCRPAKGETQFLDLSAVPTRADLPRTRVLGFSAIDDESLDAGDPIRALQIDDRSTSVRFTTTSADTSVHITFSAECSIGGPGHFDWVDIDVVLDGAVLAPTDDDDAFCSSEENDADGTNWRTDSRTVVAIGLAAGEHVVTITAIMNGGAAEEGWARFDDKSLAIVVVDN
jgi:hypothetical protein